MLSILKQIPFFESLDQELHEALIKNIEMQYYPSNYDLFKEGEKGDNMYIIKNGEVGIYSDKVSDNPIATLSSNDFFGEMALISNKPRNATAKTLTESEIFVLRKGVFQELMRTNPGIASKISDEIIRRVNENDENFGSEEETRSIFN